MIEALRGCRRWRWKEMLDVSGNCTCLTDYLIISNAGQHTQTYTHYQHHLFCTAKNYALFDLCVFFHKERKTETSFIAGKF